MRTFFVVLVLMSALHGRAAQTLSDITSYAQMCDASGAVAINDELFVIADDEDNKLRIYHSLTGGPPVKIFDTTSFLRVDPKEPEVDLEGAARIGDRIYWITSHGRNRTGKFRESRLRFFATDVVKTNSGVELRPIGKFYANLLMDLYNDPRLQKFRLDRAARLAPKAPGGFNIEGLSATPDDKLMIGLRSPIPEGRALLIPLENPADAVEGKPLRLGAPILLDLGKRGVRSMALYQGKFLIIAGASNESANAKLFLWSGGSAKPEAIDVDLTHFTPEALAIYPGKNKVQLFSDDGTRLVDGAQCKTVPIDKRSFRAGWVTP